MTTDAPTAAQLAEAAAADPKLAQLDDAAIAILTTAEAFTITTLEQYSASGDVLKRIKAQQRELTDLRMSLTRPLDDAKSRTMALFKPAGDRLARAEQTIKGAMLNFSREQERKRAASEAEARELAEKERQRLQRLAEAARERGADEKAETFEERAASVPVPIVAAEKPAVAGVATRTTWHAEVVDKLELVKAVADGRAPLSALEPNMVLLNQQARSLKGELAIPGVRAVADEGIAARAG